MKAVNTRQLYNFELGTQEGRNNSITIIIGFQEK